MGHSSDFAVATLKEWYQRYSNEWAGFGASSTYREIPGKANIEFETRTHVGSITAWDNASCLDIGTLDVRTKEDHWPVQGECHSEAEFVEKLENFRGWLRSICEASD